ncbi:MAG: cytochrome P450 [Sporichthyaceae bacterium]
MIKRRPWVLAAAARLDADAHAARTVAALRRRHRGHPVLLALPGRAFAVVTSAADVAEILACTPEPFTAATTEKTAALRHFQPHGLLISDPPARPVRRALNERTLHPGTPRHPEADAFAAVVDREIGDLVRRDALDWATFEPTWARIARGIVFGPGALDAEWITAALDRLRRRANWAYAAPSLPGERAELLAACRRWVSDPAPGSLAATLAEAAGGGCPAAATDAAEVAGQIPHWLFAFDAAGIATYRALALLAAHPAELAAVRADESGDRARAAVLESVRLWPTTLSILRQSTRLAWVRGRWAPAGTTFVVPSAYFHRDPARPYAHAFAPAIWLDGTAAGDAGLVPFSAGPAVCPGRGLVLTVGSFALRAVLRRRSVEPGAGQALKLTEPLPPTLDHTGLRLSLGR